MKGREACKGRMSLANVKMTDKTIQEYPVAQDESKTVHGIHISMTRLINERSLGIYFRSLDTSTQQIN